MTDFFALLGQPRRPWLDRETLDEQYRAQARGRDPGANSSFAEVNQAYRTLCDPKLRLQHLLTLLGHAPPAEAGEIPTDLVDLFMRIAALKKKATNEELSGAGAHLLKLRMSAEEDLRVLDGKWADGVWPGEAQQLYRRFSFLQRWQNVVAELQFESANR